MGRPLSGHRNTVTSLGFSQDGKLLATGAADRAVILWDVVTRQPLGAIETGFEVQSVAFRPNKNTLAVLGDKRLLVWDTEVEAWRDTACRIANRNLSREEWGKFFGSKAEYRETCRLRNITSVR